MQGDLLVYIGTLKSWWRCKSHTMFRTSHKVFASEKAECIIQYYWDNEIICLGFVLFTGFYLASPSLPPWIKLINDTQIHK